MTAVEKTMNKDDMIAYKKYDSKQYAMIPGTQGTKQFAEPRPKKSPLGHTYKGDDLTGSPSHKLSAAEKEEKLRIQEERMAAYGFTHLQKGLYQSQDGGMTTFKPSPEGVKPGVPQPIQ